MKSIGGLFLKKKTAAMESAAVSEFPFPVSIRMRTFFFFTNQLENEDPVACTYLDAICVEKLLRTVEATGHVL